MSVKKNGEKEYYTIDIAHIFKILLRRVWAIALAALIAGGAGFFISKFIIKPKYSSSVMLYVNNSSFSLGNTNFSISSSEITAAQSLVQTYIVILENRTTLNEVIERSGVDYEYKELEEMIDAESVDETEVFRITVTSHSPEDSERIVNTIAEVLKERVAEIVDGSSMEIVDLGVVNPNKVSPRVTSYTAVGFIIGGFIAFAIVVILAMMDDTIHDEEYILNNYSYPILAKVPDLVNSGSKSRSYYYQNYYRSKNSEAKGGEE